MSCRKMAAIQGTVRSFLTALPFLRAFTDEMSLFINQHPSVGWDRKIPLPAKLKQQLLQVKDLLLRWEGRQLQGKSTIRTLHSDSSNFGWAGVDLRTGQKVHEFWRSEAGLHINIKELKAAISTVRSLAKPGEKVFLTVYNSVDRRAHV